ncbi:metalloproteinase inhibitor 1 [Pseudophryne corroboree]|uniref:metalloproteinase inhibitor 1 n=1 Tax=Pseudophryne corroboree TaxID=495146 RepID=UPI0030817A14
MICLVLLIVLGCWSWEAQSCSCGPRHPQAAYCDSEVVLRAKFIGQSDCEKRSQWTKFEVKTTKIFKAPKDLDDIQFVYSAKQESMCGYQHTSTNKSEEFLISGNMVDGSVYITSCGFIAPWASLTYCQRRGYGQVYEKNCGCQIVPCHHLPCEISNDRQCLWTDMLMKPRSLYAGYQATKLACVDNGSGICIWDSLKSRIYAPITKTTTQ